MRGVNLEAALQYNDQRPCSRLSDTDGLCHLAFDFVHHSALFTSITPDPDLT